MKVITPKEMLRLENIAYSRGYSEEYFIDNVAKALATFVEELLNKENIEPAVLVFCGKGNNGSDTASTALKLKNKGFTVSLCLLHDLEECNMFCKKLVKKFICEDGIFIPLEKAMDISLSDYSLIIDGLFGTGFRGTLSGVIEQMVLKINHSSIPVVSADIPSGVNGLLGLSNENTAIAASYTCFLELPKIGCFLPHAWNYVGKIHQIRFGLDDDIIESAEADFILLEDHHVILPSFPRDVHKYSKGQVLGFAGSALYTGAAILSSSSALSSGAGIVKCFIPEKQDCFLAPPELILHDFNSKNTSLFFKELNSTKSFFSGPGLTTSEKSIQLLNLILPSIKVPTVLDADALNIYSMSPYTFPSQTIITPHMGELKKLLHINKETSLQKILSLAQKFTDKHQIVTIVKGSPSFILRPNQKVLMAIGGTSKMATAGSGDVLTGLIASLLAQGLSIEQAAITAVMVHQKSGEIAATYSPFSLTASQLIHHFSEAFSYYKTAHYT